MLSKTPSEYGRRLIPQILDNLAATEPDRIIFSIATFSENSHQFRHISASTFAKAVDKTAWWLRGHIGKEIENNSSHNGDQVGGQNGEHQGIRSEKSPPVQVMGYIGPHDIRHILLTYAAAKADSAALFLSPKNNVEGALAVLNAANCSVWVKPYEVSMLPLVKGFLQQKEMRVLELPGVDELLDCEDTQPFPYNKTFDQAVDEPFCVLHTSGTTGVPKPIFWTHGLIGTMDAVRLLPPTEGDGGLTPWSQDWNEGDRIYSSFPMSHGAGIIMDILMPALYNLLCILGPSDVLPNMSLIESLADHAKIDIWSMVPSLVDELGETPDVLAKFKSSKFICASGGPVSPIIASKVNDVVRVLNLTGTTEGLFIGNLWVERQDWQWFAFHPFSGFEFKEVEPGVFEHWVYRNEHWALFQGLFYTFPDKQSVNLKDLYIRHPTKPNLWAFKGRSDDVIVLSNGYKIAPLDMEALITTHPNVEGCLMIGTGKPQAGLLIELKDGTARTDKLFDSIWSTVERANGLSLQKSRLQRDYITFAEPDKPFIRTDKRTIKRNATLQLYTDYIDRFYGTRDEDTSQEAWNTFTVDTSSIETVTGSLRHILGSILPEIEKASSDVDVFSLGLDSLLVFRAVKIIRAATGLQDQLAPRHVYANPTLSKLSAAVAKIVADAGVRTDSGLKAAANGSSGIINEIAGGSTPRSDHGDSLVNDNLANMQRLIAEHKQRLGFKMNPFDAVNPNHYMGLNFFFALRPGTSFQEAFARLQEGLRRTLQLVPALDGKMMLASEHEFFYKKGEYRITIPPPSRSAPANPRQLVYKDLSHVLPSFKKMRDADFVPSLFEDKLVLDCNPFPAMPADILVAQANFVEGGCILATNFIHTCLDGIGVMVALRLWAESCRYQQGDQSATYSWFSPESFNHSLPEIIYEQEGYAKPANEVDPGVWGFLPFFPPDQAVVENGLRANSAFDESITSKAKALPPAPFFPRQPVWPAAPAERSLSTSLFLIPPENVHKLRQEVLADPDPKVAVTSISDIVQAFVWRSAIRVRYQVAKEIEGKSFGPDEMSILELPIDGRPYFSSLLPSSYMGSMLILNRVTMPVETLCSPITSVGRIAYVLREATARVTPSLFHDALTLLRSMTDYSKPATANMGIDHMNVMISNLMLFQTSDIIFGDGFFDSQGSPEAMRPQIERGSRRFRFLVISPMRSDGGVELMIGTLPEEMEIFKADAEFTKYAKLVDCQDPSI